MFEDSIISRILGAWTANGQSTLNHADVKAVLETAFLASLKREEGRPVRFSLVLASPSETYPATNNIRRFHTAPAFSIESILKLAPAFNPDCSSIGVGRNRMNGEFECWGAFYYPPRSHAFNQVPVGVKGGTALRPDLFTVTARSPGLLYISRANSRVGRFVDGDFIAASPTPFSSKSLGRHLIESLKLILGQEYSNVFWHYHREILDLLLLEAATRGHGATIVILGADGATGCRDWFLPKYVMEPHGRLKSSFKNAWQNRDILLTIAYRKVILQHVQELAQLSAVDGALILTGELELVAFGATLTAPRWAGKILLGPDGFGRSNHEAFPTQRYGTRHGSAINFAGACEGSTVFVLSQDGAVRAFVRSSADTLLWWPDCSSSMFI